MRVLIVDDSDVGRLMLAIGIGDSAECDEAVDGLEAVKLYQKALDDNNPYNLVLMDIIMPEMDGKTALKEIRKLEEARGLDPTPVYMVSASETLDGIEGLANGLMRKPPAKQQLQEIIEPLKG